VLIFAAATDEISDCYGKPWIVKEIIPIFVGANNQSNLLQFILMVIINRSKP